MIHQFAELGQFFRTREGVKDQLLQYAADPSQLAATRTRRPNLAAFFPVTMTNRLWPL